MIGATIVIFIGAGTVAWLTFARAEAAGRLGADLSLYLGAAQRWAAGGAFYPEHQLAGPYPITDGDILYPPLILLLLIPFLVLPAPLFWLVPLGTVAVVIVRHKPRPWTWPLMALSLAFPITSLKIVHGNPVMWMVGALALGTVYAWPAILVLLKPSVAPFALIGIRHRRWWVALAVLAVVSVPFGTMWLDYARVVMLARSPVGPLYSLEEVPFMLIPIIAWVGSSVEARAIRRPLIRPAAR